jgi:hypothetical protein
MPGAIAAEILLEMGPVFGIALSCTFPPALRRPVRSSRTIIPQSL